MIIKTFLTILESLRNFILKFELFIKKLILNNFYFILLFYIDLSKKYKNYFL